MQDARCRRVSTPSAALRARREHASADLAPGLRAGPAQVLGGIAAHQRRRAPHGADGRHDGWPEREAQGHQVRTRRSGKRCAEDDALHRRRIGRRRHQRQRPAERPSQHVAPPRRGDGALHERQQVVVAVGSRRRVGDDDRPNPWRAAMSAAGETSRPSRRGPGAAPAIAAFIRASRPTASAPARRALRRARARGSTRSSARGNAATAASCRVRSSRAPQGGC